MSTLLHLRILGTASLAVLVTAVHAAPGEDTVMISNKVSYLQMPTAAVTRSSSIQYRRDMPDDTAAKVSRYTAKAFSGNVGDVKTERDVVQSVKTNGTQTTCYQSVGSTTGTSSTGTSLGNNEQIVVLRGDLINICN